MYIGEYTSEQDSNAQIGSDSTYMQVLQIAPLSKYESLITIYALLLQTWLPTENWPRLHLYLTWNSLK